MFLENIKVDDRIYADESRFLKFLVFSSLFAFTLLVRPVKPSVPPEKNTRTNNRCEHALSFERRPYINIRNLFFDLYSSVSHYTIDTSDGDLLSRACMLTGASFGPTKHFVTLSPRPLAFSVFFFYSFGQTFRAIIIVSVVLLVVRRPCTIFTILRENLHNIVTSY